MMTGRISPVYLCERRNIDGFPSGTDPVWDDLPVMELLETAAGGKPRLGTSVQACWSPECGHLYFRFSGEDDGVVSTMSKHDDPIYQEDVVEVFISETGSLTRYKEFENSPANVTFDAQVHNDLAGSIRVDKGWHADGWKTDVIREEANDRIVYIWELPFRNFVGGTPAPGDRWRMNCYRIDRSEEYGDEYSAWSPTGKIDFHIPEAFGVLKFI